jgi:Na+/H+-translocating membrane pyrophosphatase
MKKIIICLTLTAVVMNPTLSNAREHDRGNNGQFGAVVAGIVIGGLLVAATRQNDEYDRAPRQRVVRVCEEIPLFDAQGYFVRNEVRCHNEVVWN